MWLVSLVGGEEGLKYLFVFMFPLLWLLIHWDNDMNLVNFP